MNLFEQLLSLTHYEKVFFFETISDEDFRIFSQVNKELFSLCYDSMETERIFKTRSENFIPEMIKFKNEKMTWKEFYIRVKKTSFNQLINYFRNGKLLELKVVKFLNISFDRFPDRVTLNGPVNILPIRAGADCACGNGDLNVLQWMVSLNPPILPSEKGVCSASEQGHLNVLKWLASLNPPVLLTGTCIGAALNGHLNVLEWVASLNPLLLPTQSNLDWVAINGHLNVLEWMASRNPPILPTEEGANSAAYGGHLNVLEWMASRNHSILPTQKGVKWAAENGHLNVLEWMASLNPPILPTN